MDRGASAGDSPVAPPEGRRTSTSTPWGRSTKPRSRARSRPGDHLEMAPFCEASAVCFERVGDARNACQARINGGFVSLEIGAYEEAETALRAGLAAAERLGLRQRGRFGAAEPRAGARPRGSLSEASQVEPSPSTPSSRWATSGWRALPALYLSEILLLAGLPRRGRAPGPRPPSPRPARRPPPTPSPWRRWPGPCSARRGSTRPLATRDSWRSRGSMRWARRRRGTS